jgi:hypothetical protein
MIVLSRGTAPERLAGGRLVPAQTLWALGELGACGLVATADFPDIANET